MSSIPDSSFFKPPPETHAIFIDLTEDDEEDKGVKIEENPEASLSLIPHSHGFSTLTAELFKPQQEKEHIEEDNEDDDELAVFSNNSGRRPSQKCSRPPQDSCTVATRQQKPQTLPIWDMSNHPVMGRTIPTAGGGELQIPNSNGFMNSNQQKRITQMERLGNIEEELQPFVEENPSDTKVHGRWLHLQDLKRKLEEKQDQVLDSGEQRELRNITSYIERKKAKNKSKEFERLAAAEIEAASSRNRDTHSAAAGGDNVMKRKEPPDHEDIDPSDSVGTWNQPVTTPCSPSYNPTTGGKTIAQDQTRERKRVRFADGGCRGGFYDDAEKEEDDDEEGEGEGKRKNNCEKTFDMTFDTKAVLKDEDEAETEQAEEESGDESSDDDTTDSSDTDSETDSETDTDV